MEKDKVYPAVKLQRETLNNRILERVLLLGDTEAQRLLDTLEKPLPRLIIPRDLLVGLKNETYRYSFSFLEDEYVLESRTEAKEDIRLKQLGFDKWLLPEKGKVLKYFTPAGERKIEGVMNFSYLGRDDFAFHVATTEGSEFLDENLSTVTPPHLDEKGINLRGVINVQSSLKHMLLFYHETIDRKSVV